MCGPWVPVCGFDGMMIAGGRPLGPWSEDRDPAWSPPAFHHLNSCTRLHQQTSHHRDRRHDHTPWFRRLRRFQTTSRHLRRPLGRTRTHRQHAALRGPLAARAAQPVISSCSKPPAATTGVCVGARRGRRALRPRQSRPRTRFRAAPPAFWPRPTRSMRIMLAAMGQALELVRRRRSRSGPRSARANSSNAAISSWKCAPRKASAPRMKRPRQPR